MQIQIKSVGEVVELSPSEGGRSRKAIRNVKLEIDGEVFEVYSVLAYSPKKDAPKREKLQGKDTATAAKEMPSVEKAVKATAARRAVTATPDAPAASEVDQLKAAVAQQGAVLEKLLKALGG